MSISIYVFHMVFGKPRRVGFKAQLLGREEARPCPACDEGAFSDEETTTLDRMSIKRSKVLCGALRKSDISRWPRQVEYGLLLRPLSPGPSLRLSHTMHIRRPFMTGLYDCRSAPSHQSF